MISKKKPYIVGNLQPIKIFKKYYQVNKEIYLAHPNKEIEAAVQYAIKEGLPHIWVVGWSFGTDLALKFGLLPGVEGAILLSPPLRFSTSADLLRWNEDGRPVIALIPELDDYLRPAAAIEAFAPLSQAELIPAEGAKHLWMGEPSVYRVFGEIVQRLNPAALPLPRTWDGPYETVVDVLPAR